MDPEDVDPTTATTKQEFGAAMRKARERAGIVQRELEKLTAGNIDRISIVPRSTLSEWETGKRLPPEKGLNATLEAFGVPEERVKVWRKIRAELEEFEKHETRPENRQLARITAGLDLRNQQIDDLREQEEKLKQDLLREQQRVSELSVELNALQNDLVEARHQARSTRDELRRKEEEYKLRLAEAQERVHDLTLQLGFVMGTRHSSEAMRATLEAAKADALATLDHVHKFDQLRHEAKKLQRAQLPKRGKSVSNVDTSVDLYVTDLDFNQQVFAELPCTWYCEVCDTCGQQAFVVCPSCGNPVSLGWRKRVPVWLPDEPRYGQVIRVRGHGYQDDPLKDPGLVEVRILRYAQQNG